MSKEPGIGTILLALAVLLSTAAIASVTTYGVMLALRLTESASPLLGERAVPASYAPVAR